MKKVKIFLAILLVGSIAILSFSCGSATANNPTESTFIVDVSKGDISLAVTGIGNLAFAILKDLSFETAGAVEEVMVKGPDCKRRTRTGQAGQFPVGGRY